MGSAKRGKMWGNGRISFPTARFSKRRVCDFAKAKQLAELLAAESDDKKSATRLTYRDVSIEA